MLGEGNFYTVSKVKVVLGLGAVVVLYREVYRLLHFVLRRSSYKGCVTFIYSRPLLGVKNLYYLLIQRSLRCDWII